MELAIIVFLAAQGQLVCSDVMPSWQAQEITTHGRATRLRPTDPYVVAQGNPDWPATLTACGIDPETTR